MSMKQRAPPNIPSLAQAPEGPVIDSLCSLFLCPDVWSNGCHRGFCCVCGLAACAHSATRTTRVHPVCSFLCARSTGSLFLVNTQPYTLYL